MINDARSLTRRISSLRVLAAWVIFSVVLSAVGVWFFPDFDDSKSTVQVTYRLGLDPVNSMNSRVVMLGGAVEMLLCGEVAASSRIICRSAIDVAVTAANETFSSRLASEMVAKSVGLQNSTSDRSIFEYVINRTGSDWLIIEFIVKVEDITDSSLEPRLRNGFDLLLDDWTRRYRSDLSTVLKANQEYLVYLHDLYIDSMTKRRLSAIEGSISDINLILNELKNTDDLVWEGEVDVVSSESTEYGIFFGILLSLIGAGGIAWVGLRIFLVSDTFKSRRDR